MKSFSEWVMKEGPTGAQIMGATREQMKGAGGMKAAAGLDLVDQIIQNMDPTKWTNLATALKRIAGTDQETLKLVDELSKYKNAMIARAKQHVQQEPQAQQQGQMSNIGTPTGTPS
jgi:hypothetical protein